MGDIVLTIPVIQQFKKEHPDAILHFLTKERYKDIFLTILDRDSIRFINTSKFRELLRMVGILKQENYDEVYDFHNSLRSRYIRLRLRSTVKKIRHLKKQYLKRFLLIVFKINLYKEIKSVIQAYAETAGLNYDKKTKWFYPVSPAEIRQTIGILKGMQVAVPVKVLKNPDISLRDGKKNPNRKIFWLSVMAASVWFTKRWPSHYIVEVINGLRKYASLLEIFLLGGNNERQLNETIVQSVNTACKIHNVAGMLKIPETAALLSGSDLLLTNDTGIMHIATGLSLPTIAIFGSTAEEFGFYPYGKHAEVLEVKLPCRPCASKGRNKCPKGHFRCMMDIKPEAVLEKIIQKIEARS